MRVRMKIKEGVPRGLCGSCTEAHIITDENGKTFVYCRSNFHHPMLVDRVVVECNEYQKIGDMDRYDAEKIGWVLESKGGRVIGFRPPKKVEEM